MAVAGTSKKNSYLHLLLGQDDSIPLNQTGAVKQAPNQKYATIFTAMLSGCDDAKLESILKQNKVKRKLPEIKDKGGRNFLHYFVSSPSGSITDEICEHYVGLANINDDDAAGQTALHHAALCTSNIVTIRSMIMRVLIKKGGDVNAATFGSKFTPLHYAIIAGNIRLIQILCHSNGIRINQESLCGDALQISLLLRKDGMVKEFLMSSVGLNLSSLHGKIHLPILAFMNDSLDIMQELFKRGHYDRMKISFGRGLLEAAIYYRDGSIIKALSTITDDFSDFGVNLHGSYNGPPLFMAAYLRHEEVVNLLKDFTTKIPGVEWDYKNIRHYVLNNDHLCKALREEKQRLQDEATRHSIKGDHAFGKGRYLEAISHYEVAFHLMPTTVKYLTKVSMCWNEVHEKAKAIKIAKFAFDACHAERFKRDVLYAFGVLWSDQNPEAAGGAFFTALRIHNFNLQDRQPHLDYEFSLLSDDPSGRDLEEHCRIFNAELASKGMVKWPGSRVLKAIRDLPY